MTRAHLEIPEKCKQCARFLGDSWAINCRGIYKAYCDSPTLWNLWVKSCEDLGLFKWNDKLTKADFVE